MAPVPRIPMQVNSNPMITIGASRVFSNANTIMLFLNITFYACWYFVYMYALAPKCT